MRQLLRELKRRKVYRVAITYVVVAAGAVQLVSVVVPASRLPAWADEFFLGLAVFGFPIAVVLAWAFEVTPEGVRRTEAAEGERTAGAVYPWVGLGLAVLAAGGIWYLTVGGDGDPEVAERTVAVLPFQVSGAGADTWRDGMVTMLNTGLDGAAGLRVIPDRTVFAAWSETRTTGHGADSDEALAVARQVGAQYAVVGSAVQLSDELRLIAEIHATRSGERLGRAEVRGAADSVTALADSLARRTLEFLVEGGPEGIPSVDLATKTTRSLPALRSFLAGERHFRAGEYDAAIGDYRTAVEEDTAFALAHVRLALSYWWASEIDAEREAWRQAEQVAHRLPRREHRLVRALYLTRTQGRSGLGADSLRRLTEAYPDDPTVWYSFGEVLWHENVPGGWPAADTAFARAVGLDPGHALYYPHYAQLAIAVHHDSGLAARRIAEMPNPKWRRYFRIPFDLAFGDSAAGRAALARLDSVSLSEMTGVGPENALRHPEEGGAYLSLLAGMLERAGTDRRFGARLVRASLNWGRVEAALARLDTLPVDDGLAGCFLSGSLSLGLPIPEPVARTYLEPGNIPADAHWSRLRCAGIYLVEKGRAEELDALFPRLLKAASSGDGGDSVSRPGEDAIDELEGYRAWKTGDPERAVQLFSEAKVGPYGPIWRGDVHRELAQLEKAEGWYRAAWTNPVAHERLGRLYEEMDRPEKAAAAYRRFIAAWEDADPELQDRVEEARRRLQELTGTGPGADG